MMAGYEDNPKLQDDLSLLTLGIAPSMKLKDKQRTTDTTSGHHEARQIDNQNVEYRTASCRQLPCHF